jgi:SPP1 family predicted phage head-tail adaptor
MTPINTGTYRHWLLIKKLAPVQDTTGDLDQRPTSPYLPFMRVRGRMNPLRGREFFSADRVNAVMTAQAFTRYCRQIQPDMILVWCGKTFNILAVIDIEGMHRELELQLQELPVDQPIRNPQ